jgi:serine/threonine-protein kinase
LNTRVPRDLETICLKCLHKAPSRRYASARELAEDLHCFLEGKPIRARPVGAAERAVKWARRRPAAALLVVAVLVIVATATGTGLWLRQQQAAQAHREEQARKAIQAALTRVNDLRREERWQEALLVLTAASPNLGEAGSKPLKDQFEQAQADCQVAAECEHARDGFLFLPDGKIDYQQRAAAYRKAFEVAGLRDNDDEKVVADVMRASAIRDQLVAATDERAVVAFMLGDTPLVERLLRIARSVDPQPAWRDRFRNQAIWRNRAELARLAALALKTSPLPPAHLLASLGQLLNIAWGWSESCRFLGEACRRRPNNFLLNREMGDALFQVKRYEEAAAYYRVALALQPKSAAVHESLGMTLFSAGQIDESLATYRLAVELLPDSRSLRAAFAYALAQAGRWVEAEAECRKALDSDPTNHLPPFRIGMALWEHQRDEDAVVMFRKAIESDPNEAPVYACLGEALRRLKRHDEAVTAYRKVLELTPTNDNSHWQLGLELAAAGRLQEGLAELQTALARQPGYALAHRELGTLLRAHGRVEEAATAFRNAVNLHPPYPQAWDGLAAALLDQGRFAEARAATEHLLELPATEAARRAQRRQLDLCDTLLSVAVVLPAILAGKERPTKVATQRALAEWCLKHKRLPATAARFYDTALSAQPSLVNDLEVGNRFHAACAAALAGCGLGKDAATLDDQRRAALRKQALDWLTAEYKAWAQRHRLGKPGDRTTAATAVRAWQHNEDLAGVRDEQALARFPPDEQRAWQTLWANVTTLAARDPLALIDRARVHVGRRQWKNAAACYAEGFELEPTDDGELCFEYAASQLLGKDPAGYRQTCARMLALCQGKKMYPYLVARACTLAPNSTDHPERPGQLSLGELQRNPDAFWSLTEQGALSFRVGRFQQAIPLLERSLVADGRPGRAVLNWLWLALAHQKLGNADEARRWLARATGWLDQQGDRMPRDTTITGLHRHNWLEAHVLLEEAKSLLR